MKKLAGLLIALFLSGFADAQAAPLVAPCTEAGPTATRCDPINSTNPMPTVQLPASPVVAAAAGTTGAVVATLAGVAAKTTYLCGFTVSGAGTGLISPVTLGSVALGTAPYQGISAGVAPFTQTFTPCIAATAVNTGISITTTADASATAVDVIAWGFQQ